VGRKPSPEWRAWIAAKSRCCDRSNVAYPEYGGRGITMCAEWANSFTAFLTYVTAAIGPRPPGTTLDRIDNDRGYEPGNIRWATRSVQMRNTSRNKWLTFNGETLCVTDWATRIGVKRCVLEARLRYGWSLDAALTLPVRRGQPMRRRWPQK
jgi:hypothetical protein